MTHDEALKLALEALKIECRMYEATDPETGAPYNMIEAITAIKKALAQPDPYKQGYTDAMNWKVQNHLEHLPTAKPEQEPVAWKLMPRDATDSMLKAMDECSTEGYDERLYAGHAASVYMAAVDAAPTPPAQPQQEPVVWMYVNKSTHETKFQKHMRDFVDHSLWSEVPLYGEPLANHEFQCVCGAVWCGDEMVHLPDKRPPAQRKPLTSTWIWWWLRKWCDSHPSLRQETYNSLFKMVKDAEAIEAAHGIKENTQLSKPLLEPDYYVYNIDGQYRLADPQPTIKWGNKC